MLLEGALRPFISFLNLSKCCWTNLLASAFTSADVFVPLGPVDVVRVPIVVHLVQLIVERLLRTGEVPRAVLDQHILDVQYQVRHITTNAVS